MRLDHGGRIAFSPGMFFRLLEQSKRHPLAAVVTAWLGVAVCLNFVGCKEDEPAAVVPAGATLADDYSPYHAIPEAKTIGAESCRECHEEAFGDWQQSDHHRAMEVATPETVEGDFNDVVFEHFDHTWKFFTTEDEAGATKYWVNAEGEDGARVDFPIDYTFGFEPLQQYLIPFPGGRYQALQVCWDSRPAEEGGQRWYHLYPDEAIPPDDTLHWTKKHFNWNYMCADCHSTGLKKNYLPEEDAYDTHWVDMNVSCEACHGPGSAHVEWAKTGDEKWADSRGLTVVLKEPGEEGWPWTIDPETNQPKRTTPLKSQVQVETCAPCHSHRTLMEPSYEPGTSFHDSHQPSVLTDALYHHDGQIDEEVYVYGSFVQSKMHHAGVRCTDCHNPHTMKLVAQGNALCVRCHQPAEYNTPAHHFHPIESTGAQCVECHMPEKNFMVVDARRDHSLRIPRPDLSVELDAPNACNTCHQDQTVEWAAEAFGNWWGKGPRNAHYGEILAAARQKGDAASLKRLTDLATDFERPGIVRASAVNELASRAPTQESFGKIVSALSDPDPAVRAQAVEGLEVVPPQQRLSYGAVALSDDSRAVRTVAARVLAPTRSAMTEAQRAEFDRAAEEFVMRQNAISDRAAGPMGLGLFYTDHGEPAKAEAAYRAAFKTEPDHVPSRVNLSETYFQAGNFDQAEGLLREAVENASAEQKGIAHESLARFFVRRKRYDEGLAELQLAVDAMPNHAATRYFYGVALNSMQRTEEGLKQLEKAHQLDPGNPEYLIGLTTINRDAGNLEKARQWAQVLALLAPENPQYQQLLQSLQ